MLTNDDKQWIRDEIRSEVEPLKSDVSTLKSDVSTLKSDVSDMKDSIERLAICFENYMYPLMSEVASAYSGSDIEFRKRAERLGEMQEDIIFNKKIMANHEIRIKTLEAKNEFDEAVCNVAR